MLVQDDRFHIITRNQSFLTSSSAQALHTLLDTNHDVKIALAIPTTAKPDINLFIPLLKIIDFLRTGLQVTILTLDISAIITLLDASPSQISNREQHYEHLITAILESLGIQQSQIKFITESEIVTLSGFQADFYKLCGLVAQDEEFSSDKLRNEESAKKSLGKMIGDIQTALIEAYLDIDIWFGGKDQKAQFELAEKYLSLINRPQKHHILYHHSTVIKALNIDFHDSEESINSKLTKAESQKILLPLLQHIIFPISRILVERLDGNIGLNHAEHYLSRSQRPPFIGHGAPKGTVFSAWSESRGMWCHCEELGAVEHALEKGAFETSDLVREAGRALNRLLEPVRCAVRHN